MTRISRKETNNVTLTATFTRDEVLKMLGAFMLSESGMNPDQPSEALTVQITPPLAAPQPWAPAAPQPMAPADNQIAYQVEVTVTLDFNKIPTVGAPE
jgi:hypothetical protein